MGSSTPRPRRLRPRPRPRRRTARPAHLARALATAGGVGVWLAAVEVGLRTRHLPSLCDRFGVRFSTVAAGDLAEPVRPDGTLELSARECRRLRALDRLLPAWPFGDGPCLRQALVAGHILRRHQPELRIGVTFAGTELAAHAWLDVDGVVLGDPGAFAALTVRAG